MKGSNSTASQSQKDVVSKNIPVSLKRDFKAEFLVGLTARSCSERAIGETFKMVRTWVMSDLLAACILIT